MANINQSAQSTIKGASSTGLVETLDLYIVTLDAVLLDARRDGISDVDRSALIDAARLGVLRLHEAFRPAAQELAAYRQLETVLGRRMN